MPTVENLDRLQGIVKRLAPLTEARRGELIRADDWNTIVSAVLDVARAVLAAGPQTDVPVHSHDDQVQLSWLDARLRTLLQEGPLGDPRNAARLAAIERRLDRADGDLGDVRETVGSLRDRVGDIATRDVARESEMTSVRLSLDGMGDSRRDVLSLREALDSIRTDLQRALELATGLVVDGKPVDAGDILRRLATVEDLRARLTRDDGELLDAASFERRLAEYGASFVSTGQLDAALKKLRPRVSEEQVAAIREDVLTAATTQVESSLASLRADVDAAIEKRLADVDSRVAAGVSAAVPGIRDEVLAASKEMLGAELERAAAETRELLERRVAEAGDATLRHVDERLEGVRDEVLGAAFEQTRSIVFENVEPLRRDVARLGDTVGTTAGELDRLRSHVGAMEDRLAGFDERFDMVLREAVDVARKETYEIVRSEVAGVHERLDGMVAEAVAARVDEWAERLRGEMRDISAAGDEGIRAEMQKLVPAYVNRAMSTLDERFARDFEERGPIWEVMARMVDERMQR